MKTSQFSQELNWVHCCPHWITIIADVIVSRDDNVDFTIAGGANQNFEASITGEDATSFNALTTTAVTTTVVGELISGLG